MRPHPANGLILRVGIAVCVSLGLSGLPVVLPAQAAADAAQIKAAFVYNFAKFVEWPDDTASPAGPMVVGVLGDPKLKAAFDETLRGKTVRGRSFIVRYFSSPDNIALCHILFVGLHDPEGVLRTLHVTERSPTLTIGEIRGFADDGGVIELVIENNQFRFEINAGSAREGGLKVSSRLLRLARSVKGN